MSKRTVELRKLIGEVITLPPAEQKLGMQIKAKRFGEILGKPVTEKDMEAGGKKWPPAMAARKAQFLQLVQKSQAIQGIAPIPREEKRMDPLAVVSMQPRLTPQARAIDENLFVTGDQPFDLSKDAMEAFKEFHLATKEHDKKPGDKAKMQDAAIAFAELGLTLFDAIYGEMEEQETDRPRPLQFEAFVHEEVKELQKKLVRKTDMGVLTVLLAALNVEAAKFNALQDTFPELEAKAEAECVACSKWIGIAQNKVPEDCRACALWLDAKADLAALVRKGSKAKKIAKAEEDLEDALRGVHGRLINPLIDRFKAGLKKRLHQLFLKSEKAAEELEAEELSVPVIAETEMERKMRMAEGEAKQDLYRRQALMKRAKEAHKGWTDAEADVAVEAVLQAQAAQLMAEDIADPKMRAKAVKEADKRYREAANYLEAKKGAKPPKLGQEALALAAVRVPIKDEDEDEDEENDEEYNPEESDEESGSESDEEEEDEKTAGGGSKRKPRTKPPKTHSGAGSFAQQQQQQQKPKQTSQRNPKQTSHLNQTSHPGEFVGKGFFRPTLFSPRAPAVPLMAGSVAFRVGGTQPRPQPQPQPTYSGRPLPGWVRAPLPRMIKPVKRNGPWSRVGGGCGCDGPIPSDEELSL